jgi:hypothetical protein
VLAGPGIYSPVYGLQGLEAGLASRRVFYERRALLTPVTKDRPYVLMRISVKMVCFFCKVPGRIFIYRVVIMWIISCRMIVMRIIFVALSDRDRLRIMIR